MKRDYYIRNYVGVFPTIEDPATHRELDFQIQTKKSVPHAVNLLAITSPGLTSALPIARRVAAKIKEQEELLVNEKFNPIRRGIVKFSEQDEEGKKRLIEQDPDYGEIYCRCECVTRAEVKQALHNVLGVSTVSGIKYRTRATMGRCQGGFCQQKVIELLARELGVEPWQVMMEEDGSNPLIFVLKGGD